MAEKWWFFSSVAGSVCCCGRRWLLTVATSSSSCCLLLSLPLSYVYSVLRCLISGCGDVVDGGWEERWRRWWWCNGGEERSFFFFVLRPPVFVLLFPTYAFAFPPLFQTILPPLSPSVASPPLFQIRPPSFSFLFSTTQNTRPSFVFSTISFLFSPLLSFPPLCIYKRIKRGAPYLCHGAG